MPPRLSSHRAFSVVVCSFAQAGSSTRTFSACSNACRHPPNFGRSPGRISPSLNRLGKQRAFHTSSSFSAPKDPYKVLGVKKNANAPEIKQVYFSLARKYHPDTNPDKDAQKKFVEIQEAYDILKDEKKRAAYDKYGPVSQQPGFDPNTFERSAGGRGFGAGGFGGFQNAEDLHSFFGSGRTSSGQADLFEQIFGAFAGGAGRTRASGFAENMQGSDLEATVGVSFMDACTGTTRNIIVDAIVNCSKCGGTGLKAGAKRQTCTSCGGAGTTSYVLDNGFHMATTCPSCHGAGSTVPRGSQCVECAGHGRVRKKKQVKVDIPAGVEDGMTIRIPGAGDAPVSGAGRLGDLLVRVNVATSKEFRRQGANLHYEARIPLHIALLGGKVRVPALDGDVDVRVPRGTQHGEQMVLKGGGVSSVFGGGKGDLFVTFSVQLPRSLTPRQREILQQYADDVEGRTNAREEAPSQPAADAGSSQSQKEPEPQAEQDNGTSFSTHSSASPASWASRTWNRFRELIGF
ncbi:uncharacterized protein LAESUDRAFT_679917 [Laetiporus sulphureus 93-53]|uniref:DnaJ homolog 1, mitochondrial n=1 Tax=Laetiporus sulphureus 93-53 TaxID=1314785 RepID=A0A165E6L2_9APHY|nr:uncharacterized protein LAESUDRAFT_679917 [Laetiporus sulphureus 93-53]KZT06338.1 hypothetical protein LAESUDRAFT_679917 [Laetiporus sulphureus 93-53]